MISFHPAQSEIAKDPHRFRVLLCGRRFGKTTLAVWEMLGVALAKPGRNVAYLSPTYQQSRDIAWAELKRIASPIAADINESRLEIRVKCKLPDGIEYDPKNPDSTTSKISLRGWESVETLRGQKFDFLVVDEVASMRNFWMGWDEVLSPALIDNKGSAMFIGTPKGFNHFYDLYNMEAKNPDYKSFHFTTYDNPYMPREEIERERLSKTEDVFAQEFLADFRKTEGLVYKEFDRKKHVIAPHNIPPHFKEVIAGADPGFTHPAAVPHIGIDADSRYYVFKEFYHRGKTDAEIVEYIAAQQFQRVYPDPENASFNEELKRKRVNTREVKKGPGSVLNGINVVRELLKSNRLFISSDCPNTILEFETYAYAEHKGARDPKENPAKENDDMVDALRYALMMDAIGSQSRGPSIAYSGHRAYGQQETFNSTNEKRSDAGFTTAHTERRDYGLSQVWDIKQQ